ncbi:hypothetical protein V9T40_009854 [Parthenolecanium corni]|uniref:Uncharacterized protein n=1 Tax=Parthenolecanium corni TaxID=536013 RepID=A0AAN9TML0_9HEMI
MKTCRNWERTRRLQGAPTTNTRQPTESWRAHRAAECATVRTCHLSTIEHSLRPLPFYCFSIALHFQSAISLAEPKYTIILRINVSSFLRLSCPAPIPQPDSQLAI